MRHYTYIVKQNGILTEGEINAVNMQAAREILVKQYGFVFYLKEMEIVVDEDKLEKTLINVKEFTDAEISLIVAAVHKAQNPFTRNRKPKQA